MEKIKSLCPIWQAAPWEGLTDWKERKKEKLISYDSEFTEWDKLVMCITPVKFACKSSTPEKHYAKMGKMLLYQITKAPVLDIMQMLDL